MKESSHVHVCKSYGFSSFLEFILLDYESVLIVGYVLFFI